MSVTKASTRLRQLLKEDGLIVAPGVYDGVTARLALEAGFSTLYMSGALTTASMLGQPDLAIATLNDFVQNASMIAGLSPCTPLIADADRGPVICARTLTLYDRAGVAALILHIEDQVQSKRCGHLFGKQIAPLPEFVTRIRAAATARDAMPGSDIVLIARTDAAQMYGMDESIHRLKEAIRAGADVAFLERVKSKEDVERTVRDFAPTPVLLNIVHGVFPLIAATAAIHGIRAALSSLKKTGSDAPTAKDLGPRDFFEIMGLEDLMILDKAAGGHAYTASV